MAKASDKSSRRSHIRLKNISTNFSMTVIAKTDKDLYEFGDYRLNVADRSLWRADEPVAITPKALELLCLLVERPNKVIAKEEIIQRLWPDTIVEEANLTQTVFLLRKALNGDASKWIETAPRRGYKFSGEVRRATVAEENEAAHSTETESLTSEKVAAARPSQQKAFYQWMAVALLLAGLLFAGRFFWQRDAQPVAPLSAIKTIAVLPFKSLETAAQDEYLGLGVSDDLITRLSNVRQITVRPTSAMRRYLGQSKDAVTIGRELGVDAVLEGNFRQADQRIRFTVQLINVSDGRTLWAEKFDEQFTNIFSVQDSISERVISSLTIQLSGAEQARFTKRFTTNSEAYRLYLQGRYFWNKRTEAGFRKSIELFNQAIALDPTYARAYTGLADAYGLLASYNFLPPSEGYPKTKAAAERAIALDDSLAEAHTSLASVLNSYEWDWRGAERAYQRAIELDPGYVTAHQWYGECLIQLGRFAEAEQQMQAAIKADPLSLIAHTNLGWTHFMARDYDRAIAQLRKVIEMDAHFVNARLKLGMAYLQKGQMTEANHELTQAQTLGGESSQILAARAHAYVKANAPAEALRLVAQLETRARNAYVEPSDIALIYTALGKKDEAFAWLEKARVQRSEALLCWLKVDPRVDPLRDDARFAELLKAIGL
jgi:TolB-like protein/DNA-binding winged helix-turn-helix (wHTH) protein/Tfp pilus assembly protein PilF